MYSTPLVFSHANSFPASTYSILFAHLRKRGFAVQAIEKLGQDSQYPISNKWKHLVQQVADFAQAQADKAGGPVWLAGFPTSAGS